MLGLSNQVLTWVTEVWRNDDLSLTARILSEINHAVDVADYSWILRLTSLEELNYSRKTSGNVLRLRCSTLSLSDDVTGIDIRVVLNNKTNTYWKVVYSGLSALAVNHDSRTKVAALILGLNDLSLYESSALICALFHRRFRYVNPLNTTCKVAQDWDSERIPLGQECPWLNLSTLFDSKTSSVNKWMTLTLTTISLIYNEDLSLTTHNNGCSIPSSSEACTFKFDSSSESRLKRGRLSSSECRTSDVERSHGKLCSRLPDGLRCDNSYSLSDVYKVTTSEISSVTQSTNTALRFTGKYRPNDQAVDSCCGDRNCKLLIDHLTTLNEYIVRDRIANVLSRYATKYSVCQ